MIKYNNVAVPAIMLSLALGLALPVRAEISQADQDAAAQRAYEASASEYNEVAAEATTYQHAAEVIEQAAEHAMEVLIDAAE